MTRISLTEQYDDRDVIAQIVRLKDGLEDISGGVIADIQIVNNDLVIQWADGSSVTLPLPDPVTGISSITGSVSGGNLTITFYFTNGTTHSFTCPLSGMASEAYVDAGLALKADDSAVVKLTGAQALSSGTKTFQQGSGIALQDDGDGTRNPLIFQKEGGTDMATIRRLSSNMELRLYDASANWTLEGGASVAVTDDSAKLATTAWCQDLFDSRWVGRNSEGASLTAGTIKADFAGITVPTDGKYILVAFVQTNPMTSGYGLFGYSKNSDTQQDEWIQQLMPCASDYTRNTVTFIFQSLSANDVIRPCMYLSAASLDVTVKTTLIKLSS